MAWLGHDNLFVGVLRESIWLSDTKISVSVNVEYIYNEQRQRIHLVLFISVCTFHHFLILNDCNIRRFEAEAESD